MGIPKLPARYQPSARKFVGGQASAYLCKDLYLDREVLVKVFGGATKLEALEKELRSYHAIKSKHVVEIYDLVELTGAVALVEEFLPGKDLVDFHLKNNNLKRYLEVVYQIASGLADIHSASCIHRDIKPKNMKFDAEGTVKIFDFGLASVNVAQDVTKDARGTLMFRAPELYVRGAEKLFTSAVDVYGFGVTAWCLATGKFPPALLEVPPQSKQKVPPFSSLSLGIPETISELLDQCLLTDPEKRPTMKRLRRALERQLLKGKHRALISAPPQVYELNSQKPISRIQSGSLGEIEISYDGFDFRVTSVSGAVFINNKAAKMGQALPASCVITLGPPNAGYLRVFLAFDLSHPEVVL